MENTREHHWWEVNTGSGNGCVPSDKKPWPELMLTKGLGHSELKKKFLVLLMIQPAVV